MIDENLPLDEVRQLFAKDRFATEAGCTIVEASKHHAVCRMPITDTHRNAQGGVMGGAIFTLADFAFAVAANIGQLDTVGVENSIRFLSAPRGTELIATAHMDKPGRSLAFATVDIADDTGRTVAIMTATGFRKAEA